MTTLTTLTTLAEALPQAEFVEHHTRVVAATPENVWQALHEARWSDLTVTAPLIAIRGLARPAARRSPRLLDDAGPVRLLRSQPPAYVVGARVARPWHLAPVLGPDVDTLEDLAGFYEPGWLKYGMDFALVSLSEGRTRLTTTTLCQPTDDAARHAFTRYWRLIRPFSGLIRLDLLRSVAMRAEAAQRAALA